MMFLISGFYYSILRNHHNYKFPTASAFTFEEKSNKDQKNIKKKRWFKDSTKHETFLTDTFILYPRNKIKCSFTQNVEIQRGIVFSLSLSIFTKNNIKAPVKMIFNRPVLSYRIKKFVYICQRCYKISCKFIRFFVFRILRYTIP